MFQEPRKCNLSYLINSWGRGMHGVKLRAVRMPSDLIIDAGAPYADSTDPFFSLRDREGKSALTPGRHSDLAQVAHGY